MDQQLIERIISLLAPNGFIERTASESRYPARRLPEGAQVTRTCPSPTGFVHIGTIYVGMLNRYLSKQTAGLSLLRIEDTDKKREVAGATDLINQAFERFQISFDESDQVGGEYGPYLQSERASIYLGYAIDLLRNGRAYPCFATPEQLQENTTAQQKAKVRPGYYGQWALWRDRSDQEIIEQLDAGTPFVLRFRSLGSHDQRINVKDVLKGALELPQNDLDVPLIKSDDHRLPTYHLAHVVDDTLMGTTLVLRGDEWLPSLPLHIELCQALGMTPFTYAHIAPISIVDPNGGGKRKLSKRKDPQADVAYWLAAGYPVEGVKAYLLGLANSTFESWRESNPTTDLAEFQIDIARLAQSRSPLLDMKKLDDLCKQTIALLPQDQFNDQLLAWAKEYDSDFATHVVVNEQYAHQVFGIERSGEQIRKDLAKWSDAPQEYGYFFDELFDASAARQALADLTNDVIQKLTQQFLKSYSADDTRDEWFAKLKTAAQAVGFATDMKAYKADPAAYAGSIADAARIIRVLLTGRNRSPDLWEMMRVMGVERATRRLTV